MSDLLLKSCLEQFVCQSCHWPERTGHKYVGEFLADKCHGKGKQIWPDACLQDGYCPSVSKPRMRPFFGGWLAGTNQLIQVQHVCISMLVLCASPNFFSTKHLPKRRQISFLRRTRQHASRLVLECFGNSQRQLDKDWLAFVQRPLRRVGPQLLNS